MADGGGSASDLVVEVPRSKDAPSQARHAVQAQFEDGLPGQQLDDLLLIVSELVTNSALYGVGSIQLRVRVQDGRVYGEVIDEGSGFVNDVREHGIDAVGKKGLLIVASVADRWGIHEGSSHVWFEIVPGDDLEAVDPELRTSRRPPQLDHY